MSESVADNKKEKPPSQSDLVRNILQEVYDIHGVAITRISADWIASMDGSKALANVEVDAIL